ncbi:MAG: M1 family aminopeptidase [Ekhidna sp.]
MFNTIFKQEIQYWLKKPVTYFFGAIFFSFAFLMFAGSAGLFDPHAEDEQLREQINSAYSINFILQYLNKLLVVLLPTIVGASIYKDFKYRVHSVVFTYPINKVAYLTSKITASFLVVLFITLGVLLAMIAVEFLPGLDPAKMGTFQIQGYVYSLVLYIIPNLFFVCSIVVAVVLFFRNIYAAFLASLIPFLLQLIFENAFAGSNVWLALTDPFAQNSLVYYTKDWTILEKNHAALPLGTMIIYNRIIWLTISVFLFIITIRSFKLHENLPSYFSFKGFRKEKAVDSSFQKDTALTFDQINFTQNQYHRLKTFWHLSSTGFLHIIKSPIFIIISILAILAMAFAVNRVTQSGDMILLPLTKVILLVPSAFYSIICLMMIFIYTGLMINREKNARINQLIDTTPTPYFILWISKLFAVIKVEVLLMVLFMVSGIFIQVTQGYYQFEIDLYLKHLFVFILIPLVIWTVAAFFIHTIIENLYVGLIVLLFGWIGLEGFPQVGLSSYLVRFNSPPSVSYSDLNGYGISDNAFFWVEGYWLCFAILLMAVVHLLWPYGIQVSLIKRLERSGKRLSKPLLIVVLSALLCMIFIGSTIYNGEQNKLNLSSYSLKDFREKFKHFEQTKSPKIRSLNASIDIYPEKQSFAAKGTYLIENPWDSLIDTLLIKTGFDEVSGFDLDRAYEEIDRDDFMKFYVIRLLEPLKKGDQLIMSFTIESKRNSLFERNSAVLENGTFIKHDVFPRLGYTFSEEYPSPTDSLSRLYHYQSTDSDLIDISLTIGTKGNQYAIGPGKLIRKWEQNGRNNFSYQTSEPVKFSFGVNSGEFRHSKHDIGNKTLEVYSHHVSNIPVIREAISQTLSFQEKYFGNYSYPELRVIEFPDSEGSYSTAFVNNIPISEIRFVSNSDKTKKKTDLSFYVPAHELIHHWWGSKLVPARAKGATMLTESITEYLTLQVYAKQYGQDQATNFLKLQHQRYWNGHNKEAGTEPPLYLVESHQQYISYGKGTVVLNGLSHLIGKEEFMQLLADFLDTYSTDEPPYPTSLDFIDHLQAYTPDSLDTFINSQLTTVSWFESKVESTGHKNSADGKYVVTLEINTSKFEIASDGSSKEPYNVKPDDWMQIGFYNQNEELISLDWVSVESNSTVLNKTLEEKPSKVVLDPNHLLLKKGKQEQAYYFQ